MADYLFVPQTVLDRWSEQGKVQVDGYVLTLLGENKAFALTAAVRFLRMEAGDDLMGLIHKVKTVDALKQMAAEHYLDSVILGENAYEVQQGFLADASVIRRAAGGGLAGQPSATSQGIAAATSPGTLPAKMTPAETWSAPPGRIVGPAPVAPPTPAAAPGAPTKDAPAKDAKASEPDMLAKFLLDNLR
jgi:hypothetical protein